MATCHWQILCSYMCIYWRINWLIDRECIKKIPAYSEVLQLVWSACQRSKENSCGLCTERKHRCQTNRRTKYNTVQMNAFVFCMLFSYIILLFNFFYHWILLFTYTIHTHTECLWCQSNNGSLSHSLRPKSQTLVRDLILKNVSDQLSHLTDKRRKQIFSVRSTAVIIGAARIL